MIFQVIAVHLVRDLYYYRQFQEMLEEIPPGQVIVRTIANYTGYIVDIYFYNIIILV